jgi:hypothetical protein
VVLTVKE